MPKRETVSTAELNELLKQHEGDRSKVAEVLGMDLKYVSRRIIKTPALRAISRSWIYSRGSRGTWGYIWPDAWR